MEEENAQIINSSMGSAIWPSQITEVHLELESMKRTTKQLESPQAATHDRANVLAGQFSEALIEMRRIMQGTSEQTQSSLQQKKEETSMQGQAT